MHAGGGKNAADLLLAIDAMELALTGDLAAFVLASSDRDHAQLALRLRERGLHVLGVGEAKAPEAFRMACTAFRTLGDGEDGADPKAPPPPCGASDFDRQIRDMIDKHSQKGQGMRIAGLGARMRAEHGTQIGTRPERTWRAYLSARPALYELDPRGPEAMVRFLPEGFRPA